jgi:hypothetical protein
VTEESNPRRPRRTAGRAVTGLVLAGVAALALAACQVQPGAAAFVGNDRITRSQVDDVTAKVTSSPDTDFGSLRQETVAALITANLAGRLARQQGVTVKAPDYRAAADRVKLFGGVDLPTSNGYVRATAEADAAIDALRPVTQPAKPSETDLTTLLEVLILSGSVQQGTTVDDLRDQLDTPEAEQAVGVREALTAAAHQYHVTINPVYGQVFYPISVPYLDGQATGAIALRMGSASTAPVKTVSATPSSDTGE